MTTLLAHSLTRSNFTPAPGIGDFLGLRTLSLRGRSRPHLHRPPVLVEDDSNDNKVLGKYQSQRQLPTAVRRDGPYVRALGTLFLIYHRPLSHLIAR